MFRYYARIRSHTDRARPGQVPAISPDGFMALVKDCEWMAAGGVGVGVGWVVGWRGAAHVDSSSPLGGLLSTGLTMVAVRSIITNAQMRDSDVEVLAALGQGPVAVELQARRAERALAQRDGVAETLLARNAGENEDISFLEGAWVGGWVGSGALVTTTRSQPSSTLGTRMKTEGSEATRSWCTSSSWRR